jgi:hypothetical protein
MTPDPETARRFAQEVQPQESELRALPLASIVHRLALSLAFFSIARLAAAEPPPGNTSAVLPFDREVINRYSLNGRPRSLSVRQGSDVWLGYDLEQAKPFKVWQAPAGKPGVLTTVFVSRSAGTPWFDDASREAWRLQRGGKTLPLTIRYLGCSQRDAYFELSWELKHDAGVLKLRERIPRVSPPAADRVVRELRVESLAVNEALIVPGMAGKAWTITTDNTTDVARLVGTGWHRLTLP